MDLLEEIGEGAGAVWRYLDEQGPATMARLRRGTKLSEDILLMALGWLAREGKLRITRDKRGVHAALEGR